MKRAVVALVALTLTVGLGAAPASATQRLAGAITSTCNEGTAATVSFAAWQRQGVLTRLEIESQCSTFYWAFSFSNSNVMRTIVIAPGGSAKLSKGGLSKLDLRIRAKTFSLTFWSTSPCLFPPVDYLLQADGSFIPDPCA